MLKVTPKIIMIGLVIAVVIGVGTVVAIAYYEGSDTKVYDKITDDVVLTVDTKYRYYSPGETVPITGKVVDQDGEQLVTYLHAVTIQVLYEDEMKHVAQVDPQQDGSFEVLVQTSTSSWDEGEYKIKAFYDQNMANMIFNLRQR